MDVDPKQRLISASRSASLGISFPFLSAVLIGCAALTEPNTVFQPQVQPLPPVQAPQADTQSSQQQLEQPSGNTTSPVRVERLPSAQTNAATPVRPIPNTAPQPDASVQGQYYSVPTRNPGTGQVFFSTVFIRNGLPLPAGSVALGNNPQAQSRDQTRPSSQPTASGGNTSSVVGTVVSSRVIGRTTQPLAGNTGSSLNTSTSSPTNVGPTGAVLDDTPTSFGVTNLHYPPFLLPGKAFTTGPAAIRDSGRVSCALTFDDGPHPELDPKVLDILQQKRVTATFFYLGRLIETNPDIVRRALREGHEVGQHSYDHKDLSKLGASALASQFDRTSSALAQIGARANVFRPPYGAYNNQVLSQALTRGMETVNWTNDSLDWKLRNPVEITNQVMGNAAPGDVILLHSIQRATVVALPGLIDKLRAKGCQFTTVSTWLNEVT